MVSPSRLASAPVLEPLVLKFYLSFPLHIKHVEN